jgi:predicted nucleic acid-binding protein
LLAEAREASAPDLADVETVAVLRKRWLGGTLTDARFEAAVEDLISLPIRRFPTAALMRRAFELRANVTARDAASVALAEALGCDLATADARLARAPGLRCGVRIVEPDRRWRTS